MTENCPCALTSAEWDVLEMVDGVRDWEIKPWTIVSYDKLCEMGLIGNNEADHYLTERGRLYLTNRGKFTLDTRR